MLGGADQPPTDEELRRLAKLIARTRQQRGRS
jgi:hypothetical protein